MLKWVLGAILIVLAAWYFEFSRTMTEESIHERYRELAAAMRKFDGETICAAMAPQYSQVTVMNGRREAKNKLEACDDTIESMSKLQRLSEVTRGLLEPDFEYDIKKITLSGNKKTATVEVVTKVMLGDNVIMRGRSTETLIRRNGRILSTGGEGRIQAYAGG